ncbi:MAG: Sua5/YciO/YrdC/YwlC family protein [Betaproteobacteria bacterium]|nr:Sua5/YciO/YrdC/YwlC family protein [Betaproteobacteria bacterium]MDE1981941.1 Sua5/YciO/YrdC/YwlC family protein [Betaproteobacteria bacterium]MDE2131839.1 Sua5/YciO/YrdC/YwlC family protein [Betaproteobacteria bacterium]MDE2211353.1 Sua5/YciO/YrdC/YwlC family protein [Betaproteobacteria bacterium]MDE2624256.1 Sua5/YciO/YrdC/YwlC family protein [Betaproteobacteria bacterium]
MQKPTYVPRALRAYLRQGGVIAYATRAVFGLGCDPSSVRGLRRLLAIKRRPVHKGMIVIADRSERLARFHAPLAPAQKARCESRWPGSHTWLVPSAPRVPLLLLGRHRQPGQARRIALRVDAHPDAVNLCRRLEMALVSTSANRAGRRPIRTTRECLRQFGKRVRVIPGRVVPHCRPSTISDLLTERILRT